MKSTMVLDITIFGTCLFAVLLLAEFEAEIGSEVRWTISVPLILIGLFFGFRAANQDESKK